MFHELHSVAFEKAKLEARRKGLGVAEQLLADGTIRLNIASRASAASEPQ